MVMTIVKQGAPMISLLTTPITAVLIAIINWSTGCLESEKGPGRPRPGPHFSISPAHKGSPLGLLGSFPPLKHPVPCLGPFKS